MQALDQQHDRDHGDRQREGGEEHGAETLARFVLSCYLRAETRARTSGLTAATAGGPLRHPSLRSG